MGSTETPGDVGAVAAGLTAPTPDLALTTGLIAYIYIREAVPVADRGGEERGDSW